MSQPTPAGNKTGCNWILVLTVVYFLYSLVTTGNFFGSLLGTALGIWITVWFVGAIKKMFSGPGEPTHPSTQPDTTTSTTSQTHTTSAGSTQRNAPHTQSGPQHAQTHSRPPQEPPTVHQIRYEWTDDLDLRLNALEILLESSLDSEYIWLITDQQEQTNQRAAARTVLDRELSGLEVAESHPHIQANVPLMYFVYRDQQIFLLPNKIGFFNRRTRTMAYVPYRHYMVDFGLLDFLEDDCRPGDAEQVGDTWMYLNQDGSPDRRYASNRVVPIYQYGVVTLRHRDDPRKTFKFIFSNVQAAEVFAAVFHHFTNSFQDFKRSRQEESSRQSPQPAPQQDPLATAHQLLQVQPGATREEVRTAYRILVKQYHPDKLGRLAPDEKTQAESHMKDINAAYELIRNSYGWA